MEVLMYIVVVATIIAGTLRLIAGSDLSVTLVHPTGHTVHIKDKKEGALLIAHFIGLGYRVHSDQHSSLTE
jgi:hypothetical protein